MKRPATDVLLRALRIRPGQTIVELGAGTGELSRRLATSTGSTGRVVSSDVADGMIELLSHTTADLANVEVKKLDAMQIDLPEASADVVVFRMGLMLLPAPEVALRGIRRILRPGGRGIVVWAGPEHNPWMVAVGLAAMVHGLGGAAPTAPGMPFSLSEVATLRSLLSGAGFVDVDVEAVETPSAYADEQEHFDTVASLAGPLGQAIAAASPEQVDAMRATAAEVLAPHRTEAGLVVPGRTLVATAAAG